MICWGDGISAGFRWDVGAAGIERAATAAEWGLTGGEERGKERPCDCFFSK